MRELSLNIMDIAQNSVVAKASLIEIRLHYNTWKNDLEILIADDGCGMTQEQVKNVQSPYYTTRTTRKVGLGVPLFKMAAEMTGGGFSITSQVGQGTVVTATFKIDHIDMMPMGDINGTVLLLISCNPEIDFVYEKAVDNKGFTLDTRELREVLGEDVPLSSPDVVEWIKAYLAEQESTL